MATTYDYTSHGYPKFRLVVDSITITNRTATSAKVNYKVTVSINGWYHYDLKLTIKCGNGSKSHTLIQVYNMFFLPLKILMVMLPLVQLLMVQVLALKYLLIQENLLIHHPIKVRVIKLLIIKIITLITLIIRIPIQKIQVIKEEL